MNSPIPGIFAVLAILMMCSISSFASISSIKSDMCQNPECLPSVVQPVVRGSGSVPKVSFMTVKGTGVDLSTGVSVSGTGVTAVYGSRTHGTGSSIVIQFSVSGTAALGTRTVTMNYLVGSDTFTIRVIRGGTITQLRRVLDNGTLAAPTNLPVNQPVTLRFTGTSIGNASIARNFDIGSKSGGCGTSESTCNFTVTFTRVGSYNINLIDNALPNQNSQSYSKFYYAGPDEITVVGETAPSTYYPVGNMVSGGISSPPSIDAAPRSFIANVVRLGSSTPAFTQNGFSYYRIVSPENLCYGMSGTASKTITVPNPVWGVTNVGSNEITASFQAQLRSGTQLLATGNVTAGLDPGASQTFTYDRPGDSRLSVFTFLDRIGCYASPTAVAYFVDPAFTVVSDSGGVLTESNETNNTRTY